MLKINKINKKVFETNVQGQACDNDCKVKVWSGKKKQMVLRRAVGIHISIHQDGIHLHRR